MNRTIIVGDIHGCYDELVELCDRFKISFSKDRVILLGDLVHKGPSSAKVISFMMENQIESVMGNHDDFFLKALKNEVEPYQEYFEILSNLSFKKPELINWLSNRPLFLNEKKFLIVHAGIDPDGFALQFLNREILLNIRYWDAINNKMVITDGHSGIKNDYIPWYECLKLEKFQNKKIFYGHWAKKEVQIHGNGKIIGLDTGCCYGGKLTAYILEEERLIQIKSKQKKQFDY
jgi:predicted phosphodiesterase